MGHRTSNKTMGIQEKDFLDINPTTMKTNYQQWWIIFQNSGRLEIGPGMALLFPDNGARQQRVMEALAEEVRESSGAQATFEYTRAGGLSPYKTPYLGQPAVTPHQAQPGEEGTPVVNRQLPFTPMQAEQKFNNSIREAAKTIIMAIGATIGPNIRRRVASSTSPWQRAMQTNDLLQILKIINVEYKNVTRQPKQEMACLIREMSLIREQSSDVAQTMQKQEQLYYQIETARKGVLEYDNINAKDMIQQLMVDIQMEAYEHPKIRQEIRRARASGVAPKTQDGIRVFMQEIQDIIGTTTQMTESSHYTGEGPMKHRPCYAHYRDEGCPHGEDCKFSHDPKDRKDCYKGTHCPYMDKGCPHIHRRETSRTKRTMLPQ